MIVLYLESLENNLFELDFSISKKRVSTDKHSQEEENLLHGDEISWGWTLYFWGARCSFLFIRFSRLE